MKHSVEFLSLADAAKKRIKQLAPEQAKGLAKSGAVIVDVRDKEEFETQHIDGAVNISRGTLEMRIAEAIPDKNTPVVCYCTGGNRGALATDTLVSMGYKNAVSIAGGLNAYLTEEKKNSSRQMNVETWGFWRELASKGGRRCQ